MDSVLFSKSSDEWTTPESVFDSLNAEFNFTLDPCATSDNHKCAQYFTKDQDGLTKNWGGVQRVLQSTLQPDLSVGPEVLPGITKAWNSGCYAHSSKDRHTIFS